MKEKAARTADAAQLAKTAPADLPFGVPASYWLDLLNYDPPASAQSLNHSMLILQGARDYQVTMKDFERWQAALRGKPNVQFKVFPQLNHLFMPGQGKSSPGEYNRTGHVSETVIDHIANWIEEVSAP